MNKKYLTLSFPFWLWLISIGLILSLSVFGRRLQSQFFSQINMMWLAIGVLISFSLILCFLYRKRKALAVSKLTLFGVILLIAGGVLAVYTKKILPIETIHFFVFFSFGWITAIVFGIKRGVLVVLAVAVSDEILQIYLPDRVGDIHDVVINGLSGTVGLLLGKRRRE